MKKKTVLIGIMLLIATTVPAMATVTYERNDFENTEFQEPIIEL